MKNCEIFNEKSDFFIENERFSKLIKFYSRKADDKEIEADLWAFLWFLRQRKPPPPSDNYIAVCLRNEYIKLSKFYDSLKNFEQDYPPAVDKLRNYEFLIDLKNALNSLSVKEKSCFILNAYYGFSIYEIALFFRISPQAVSKNRLRAIKKLRVLLS